METNILENTAALRPSIEALVVGQSIDLPKELFTAAAARKAAQRISTDISLFVKDEPIKTPSGDLTSTYSRLFKVSETAYPGGTRVTIIR